MDNCIFQQVCLAQAACVVHFHSELPPYPVYFQVFIQRKFKMS